MSKLRLDTLEVTTFATTPRSTRERTTGSPACPISFGGTCWVTCWETCYCETVFEC